MLPKISQYCPKKSENYAIERKYSVDTLRAHDVTLNLVKFVYFSVLVLDRNIIIPTFDSCES